MSTTIYRKIFMLFRVTVKCIAGILINELPVCQEDIGHIEYGCTQNDQQTAAFVPAANTTIELIVTKYPTISRYLSPGRKGPSQKYVITLIIRTIPVATRHLNRSRPINAKDKMNITCASRN